MSSANKTNKQIDLEALQLALEQFLLEKEAFLDSFIDSGNDQELFLSSYLHGHFSVITAQTISMSTKFESLEQAKASVQVAFVSSLEQAIKNNELDPKDAEQAMSLSKQLFA